MLTRGLPLRERQSRRACAKLLCGVHGGVRGQPFSKPHLALSLSSVSVLPFEGSDYISGGQLSAAETTAWRGFGGTNPDVSQDTSWWPERP